MHYGENIFITNGKCSIAKCNLVLECKKVSIDIIEIKQNSPLFPIDIHIAIAPTKISSEIYFSSKEIKILEDEDIKISLIKFSKIKD